MRKLFALTVAAMVTTGLSAWAAEPPATKPAGSTPPATHTAEAMTKGHHRMPGNKHDQMSNKVMPGMNPKCSDEAALAKMPADHRAACHKD